MQGKLPHIPALLSLNSRVNAWLKRRPEADWPLIVRFSPEKFLRKCMWYGKQGGSYNLGESCSSCVLCVCRYRELGLEDHKSWRRKEVVAASFAAINARSQKLFVDWLANCSMESGNGGREWGSGIKQWKGLVFQDNTDKSYTKLKFFWGLFNASKQIVISIQSQFDNGLGTVAMHYFTIQKSFQKICLWY